jgi:replication factor C small subunit
MDRGIDVIREKVKIFSQSMSSETGVKRLVFMDEADGLTPASQTSLRNVIEEYSDNVFFIFTANDISKIIEPIRSRCITISFDSPNKVDILLRLEDICEKENLNYTEEIIEKLVNLYYPDIRSMILSLQKCSIEGNFTQLIEDVEFGTFLTAIKKKDIKYLYQKTYDGSFNLLVFNKWFFKYLYDNSNLFSFKQLSEISRLLAETEKAWNLGANLPIIFLSNILQISSILS